MITHSTSLTLLSEFNLSRNTINLWLKRQAETGDFQAKPNIPAGNGHKITDWDKFRTFAKAHGDKTQTEMAQLWQGEISARTISRALQKIGFTRKKKTYGYREREETKRQALVEQLSRLSLEQIVYLDEAGMDSRDDYAYGWNERGERFHALKSGRREGRVNMIAALCNQQLIAPFTVEGARNIEWCLRLGWTRVCCPSSNQDRWLFWTMLHFIKVGGLSN